MTAPISSNSFYADPQGLSGLKNEAKAQDPEALRKVARQFESLFTQMILKNMRASNQTMGDNMFSSSQTEFYEGMFDDQLAVHMSEGRGLGLADMLVQQLSQSNMLQKATAQGTAMDGKGLPLRQNPAIEANLVGTRSQTPAVAAVNPNASATLSPSKEDFLRTMWPHAQKVGAEIGVDPHALLAQAALETGWGKSMSTRADGGSNNLFGIKAGSQWNGATVNVPTIEFESGVAVRKVEKFRAYASAEESFRDYAGLISNNPRYEKALQTGGDINAFANALQQGGYATDPQYASKIVAVAGQLRQMTNSNAFKSMTSAPLPNGGGV